MLKIRLARGGAKKRPYYSIVVADSHSPRDGRFIEKVGAYNPLLKRDDPKRITLNSERITEWLSKGAQARDRPAARAERAAAAAATPEPEAVEEAVADEPVAAAEEPVAEAPAVEAA